MSVPPAPPGVHPDDWPPDVVAEAMEHDLDVWDRIAIALPNPDDRVPSWRKLKAAVSRRQAQRNGHTVNTVPPAANRSYVDKAISDELATLAAERAIRNITLNNVALRLARLLPYTPQARGWLHDRLVDACHRNGVIADDGLRSVEMTIGSAFRKADQDGPAPVPEPAGPLSGEPPPAGEPPPPDEPPPAGEPTEGEPPPPDEPPPDADDHHTGEYRNEDNNDENSEPTTWEPVDLGPWLNGEVQRPEPSLGITRSDGLRFIYPAREHAFVGETESGKTWLALGCVVPELMAGNYVVYIHYEEADPGSTIERLQTLGVGPSQIAERLRFIGPCKPARTEWVAALLDPRPTLVVHDGVNEAMSLIGADIMAADGAARFRRQLIVPFLRVGAASIACDHVPKDRDSRGRDAYGSVHKGNALDGARLVLENMAPFGRGLRGASNVFVTKDRPGQLRVHGRSTGTPGKTYVGTLVGDDSEPFEPFSLMFYAPKKNEDGDSSEGGDPAARLADTVYDVVAAQPEKTVSSTRELFALMRLAGHQIRESDIRNALDDLTVSGRVKKMPGKRGANSYRAIPNAAQESET